MIVKSKFIALSLLLTVSACFPKKKRDVEPDLAGTYQVSQIKLGQLIQNYPDGQGSSGNVVVTRPSDDQIKVTVNITEDGSTEVTDFGTLPIRKASGGDYDVLNATSSTRLGSINGTNFRLDFDVNGDWFELISKK